MRLAVVGATGVDVISGRGLAPALQDVDVVVDASNTGAIRRRTAVDWFERAATTLTTAADRAGVAHVIALSIVGIDRVPLGYYAGKRAQEEVVTSGPVPWTVVRATQFFSFPLPFLKRSVAGVALVPSLRSQPVSVEAVATLIVDIAESAGRRSVLQIAGPAEMDTLTMAREISARFDGPRVRPMPLSRAVRQSVRSGGLLPDPGAHIDSRDFAAWLATADGV